MQLLYTYNRDRDNTLKKLNKVYYEGVDMSFQALMYNFYCFLKVASIAENDLDNRSTKYLPTPEDKKFKARLFKNDHFSSVMRDVDLLKIFKRYSFEAKTSLDAIKKIYNEFATKDEYKNFIMLDDKSEKDITEVLLALYRFCRRNEVFTDLMEDQFINWEDDESLIVGSLKKIIKALPYEEFDYKGMYYPDDETVKVFGESLLNRTFEDDEELLEQIKPVLKNWDHERVAVIDMILIKMALCEFLDFNTIPTKVTLNEYVELSKMYSTPKSKEFINGVLDQLVKQLEDEGKIEKEGRGLV